MSAERHVVLNVPDISCGHCKAAIEKAVAAVDGVESVVVEVADKSVDLRYDADRVSVDEISAAIAAEGYAVAGQHAFGE
jgi:copper chaperone